MDLPSHESLWPYERRRKSQHNRISFNQNRQKLSLTKKKYFLLCTIIKEKENNTWMNNTDHLSWTLKVSYQAFFPFSSFNVILILLSDIFLGHNISMSIRPQRVITYRDSIMRWEILFLKMSTRNDYTRKKKWKKICVDKKWNE